MNATSVEAIVLAGGLGTRLRPLTDTRPKPLVPFMTEPFALGLLRRLADAGCPRATFLVAEDPAPFDVLTEPGRDLGIEVVIETENQPLDTAGGARRLLRNQPSGAGPFLVCNGDVLTDLDYAAVVAHHRDIGAVATLVLTRVPDTSSYGVVVCDDGGRATAFVEKPPAGTVPADTINAGTYVLEPAVFQHFPGDGPLSFERAVFPGLLEGGAPVAGYTSEAYWLDLGTPDRFIAGHRAVLEGDCAWPVAAGLRGGDRLAAVHPDASVDPEADLGDVVVVGADSRIAAGARLVEAVLLDGVVIAAGAMVRQAILGTGVRVGERAVVGPGAVLGDGAVVPPGGRAP